MTDDQPTEPMPLPPLSSPSPTAAPGVAYAPFDWQAGEAPASSRDYPGLAVVVLAAGLALGLVIVAAGLAWRFATHPSYSLTWQAVALIAATSAGVLVVIAGYAIGTRGSSS